MQKSTDYDVSQPVTELHEKKKVFKNTKLRESSPDNVTNCTDTFGGGLVFVPFQTHTKHWLQQDAEPQNRS